VASGSPDERVDLSVQRLLADACELTGHTDFGLGFRDNLEALLDMYGSSARYTPRGLKSTRKRLLGLLANRLRIEAAFARHPDIHARRLEAPMYLVGLPRTGTSALLNLLELDTSSRPLRYWESQHPDPSPGLEPGQLDPRLAETRALIEQAYARNPAFAAIHRVRAEGAEECVQLLAHTLGSVQMGIEPLITPYREYFAGQDQRENYRYYVGLLKLLDWQRPGQRWLLKSPAHLWALTAIFESFPDACMIWTHRDPAAVVGSYCSMVEVLSTHREAIDPNEIGAAVLEYLGQCVERGMSQRRACPADRFVDVHHHEFVANPLGVVQRVYAAFGLSLDAGAAARMRAEIELSTANPRSGEHRYSLARYGLNRDQVHGRFRAYMTEFGLLSG